MKNTDILELLRIIRSRLSGKVADKIFNDDGHLFRKYHDKGLDFIYDLDLHNLDTLFNWARKQVEGYHDNS